MLKNLFLSPGRLLINIFSGSKRRNYRSTRSRPSVGLGAIILSLICWLVIAGGALFALDKAGILKQALDTGVEVTGVNDRVDTASGNGSGEGGSVESDTPIAGGQLKPEGSEPGAPPQPQGAQNMNPGADTSAVNQQSAEVPEMWVVMLHSIPKRARDEADRLQRQYRSKGLEVEVLDSDAFPLLKSGHWIVAMGPYDDKADATAAANRAAKFNTDLMIRRGL